MNRQTAERILNKAGGEYVIYWGCLVTDADYVRAAEQVLRSEGLID